MINPFRSRPFTKRKCVGVVGLLQAGKTVMITSLIDHLKNHDPAQMPIGKNGAEVIAIDLELRPATSWRSFDFSLYRSQFAEGKWPRKTLVPEEFRGLFCRDDWRRTLIDLSLLDIPGERMADMTIAACPKFSKWSDVVEKMLRTCPEFREAARPFLQLVDNGSNDTLDPEGLLAAYRRTLARMIISHMPIVTPSSFLVTSEGRYVADDLLSLPKSELEAELVQRQHVGFSPDEQFAPLPLAHRERYPDVAKRFARHYKKYRKQVVMPLAKPLQACNELLILVDIATILENGVGFLNATHKLLEQVMEYIKPGSTPAGKVGQWLSYGATLGFAPLSHVERVTFVATQADRVHAQDRGKLEGLVRQLTSPLIKPFKPITNARDEYFVCAAVELTRSSSDDGRVIHFKQRNSKGQEFITKQMEASAVPDTWPNSWVADNYEFPEPDVWMPKARTNPPRQFGLHRIAEQILS